MSPNFLYLTQELKKLDQLVSPISTALKTGLKVSETPGARKVMLDVLDEISRLRKMTHRFSSETERHNWHLALDRHQQIHLLILGEIVRAEFAPQAELAYSDVRK
jgi:hypothetical protein